MEFDIELMALELGKSLEDIIPRVEAELYAAVDGLANAAYSSMVAQIQARSMDPKNRQDYLKGLKINKLGEGSWLITLEGSWANDLEEGLEPYDMKAKLLSSQKTVSVGKRAGQKWVRTNKDGGRFAAVPFSHKPYSKEKSEGAGGLADILKKQQVMNRSGAAQPFTSIFKDIGGKAITGKVATLGKMENPNLSNMVKMQHVSKSGSVSSVYMTYRMISDNSSADWKHPGTKGINLFDKMEKEIQKELENIIKNLL